MFCCCGSQPKLTASETTTLIPASANSDIYTCLVTPNPFAKLFTENCIDYGGRTNRDPTKKQVSDFILQNTAVTTKNIEAFAQRHADKLKGSEKVKTSIKDLATLWNDNDNFDHRKAEEAIKTILGKKTQDEDVIFMLRLFCITNEKSSDFDTNYQDLMKHVQ